MIQSIYTNKAPEAIGPYSQAYMYNNRIVITSGHIPIHPDSGEVVGDTIAEQTHQVIQNINAILENANMGAQNIIKTTCFLADMKYFNEIYGEYFISKPARSCIAVMELPKQVLCEIEVIAVKLQP